VSNISRRRLESPVAPPAPEELDDDPDESDDEAVEYLVDADELDCWRTSVPNSVQSLQTSSSAPSIFTVVGFAT